MSEKEKRITIIALQEYAHKCEILGEQFPFYKMFWTMNAQSANNAIKQIKN